MIIGFWIMLFRWLMPWMSARQFRRQNPIADHPLRIEVSDEGVRSEVQTSSTLMKWSGVLRVVETEAFFLFYTTPMCALFLPTRAIGGTAELEALRRTVRREKGDAATLRG